MLILIYILTDLAAVFFIGGTIARFVHNHEGTVRWRGSLACCVPPSPVADGIYFLLGGPR